MDNPAFTETFNNPNSTAMDIHVKNQTKEIHLSERKNNQNTTELQDEHKGIHEVKHPTNYAETLMHLFKGNVGTGVFALGYAFRNAGIIAGPIMTVTLGIIAVHCQHILITCSKKMKENCNLKKCPDFAETVELCFKNGEPSFRKLSTLMKILVNIFLCATQLGFCCIYLVFVTLNVQTIISLQTKNIVNFNLLMFIVLIPIALPALITNLKYLAPFSAIANICMALGIGITLYFCMIDLPSITERDYIADLNRLPLFFGTAMFAFEGIGLVLPLQNSMKIPENFAKTLGVLNIGMVIITTIFVLTGFFGYLKFGEDVQGSLTLNLPDDPLSLSVQIMLSISITLTYALQLHIPVEILWPVVKRIFNIKNNFLLWEEVFRCFLIICTFAISELIPNLGLFISFIGAVCSTSLALVFPPLIELVLNWNLSKRYSIFMIIKNIVILLIALVGFSTGGYESIVGFINEFSRSKA